MATDADWETVKEDDHDNKSTDSIESYSMGEIIDKIGFTKFHIPLILLTSVGFLASNIQLILMSVLQPILRKYFSREKHIELYTALMISAQFLGAIIGGSLGGIWADRYGRLSIFHGSTAIAATFSIIFTLLNFPIMMIGCRFMIGFAIGAGSLSDFSLLAEFLPSKYVLPACLYFKTLVP